MMKGKLKVFFYVNAIEMHDMERKKYFNLDSLDHYNLFYMMYDDKKFRKLLLVGLVVKEICSGLALLAVGYVV